MNDQHGNKYNIDGKQPMAMFKPMEFDSFNIFQYIPKMAAGKYEF